MWLSNFRSPTKMSESILKRIWFTRMWRQSPATKLRKPKGKSATYKPAWIKSDLKEADATLTFPWKYHIQQHQVTSHRFHCLSCFSHRNCWNISPNETNEYAVQKGRQNFLLDISDDKLFLTILLISGCFFTAELNVLGSQWRCPQLDGICSHLT